MSTWESLIRKWVRWDLTYGDQARWWFLRLFSGVAILMVIGGGVRMTQWALDRGAVQSGTFGALAAQTQAGTKALDPLFQPQALNITPVEVVLHPTTSSVDVISVITNPNAQWTAIATANFVAGGVHTQAQEITIAPQSTRVIASSIALPSLVAPTASVLIDEIRWKRSDHTEAAIFGDHPIALESTSIEGGNADTYVTVELQNATLFRFRNVQVLLRWYEGATLTGARILSIGQWNAGERKRILFRSDRSIPTFARFIVDPLFNVFDPNVQ